MELKNRRIFGPILHISSQEAVDTKAMLGSHAYDTRGSLNRRRLDNLSSLIDDAVEFGTGAGITGMSTLRVLANIAHEVQYPGYGYVDPKLRPNAGKITASLAPLELNRGKFVVGIVHHSGD